MNKNWKITKCIARLTFFGFLFSLFWSNGFGIIYSDRINTHAAITNYTLEQLRQVGSRYVYNGIKLAETGNIANPYIRTEYQNTEGSAAFGPVQMTMVHFQEIARLADLGKIKLTKDEALLSLLSFLFHLIVLLPDIECCLN